MNVFYLQTKLYQVLVFLELMRIFYIVRTQFLSNLSNLSLDFDNTDNRSEIVLALVRIHRI